MGKVRKRREREREIEVRKERERKTRWWMRAVDEKRQRQKETMNLTKKGK